MFTFLTVEQYGRLAAWQFSRVIALPLGCLTVWLILV